MATSPRPSQRRRQRSVRLTLAVSLLSVAAGLVVVAVSTQSVALLNVAAVGALLLGASAARILHTELLQSRRVHAADRSAQAQAYRRLTDERVAENATFTSAMTARLAGSARSVRELEGTLVLAERRVAESEQKASTAGRRAQAAEQAAVELREALEARVAELAEKAEQVRASAEAYADEKAAEEAAVYASEAETIVDLLAWDQRSRPAPTPALKQA
ncbi:MAG: hypothetical protein Q8Q02_00770 [Nocardioides sp.]|nr:hypothetical protein [Nocardioides sp.]